MAPAPSWWTWRDRAAARLGPWFFPAWFIAPRSTRDRWAAFAELVDDDDQVQDLDAAVELLDAHGVDALQGVRRPGKT